MGLEMSACVSEKRHVGALGSRAGNGWSGKRKTCNELLKAAVAVMAAAPCGSS